MPVCVGVGASDFRLFVLGVVSAVDVGFVGEMAVRGFDFVFKSVNGQAAVIIRGMLIDSKRAKKTVKQLLHIPAPLIGRKFVYSCIDKCH